MDIGIVLNGHGPERDSRLHRRSFGGVGDDIWTRWRPKDARSGTPLDSEWLNFRGADRKELAAVEKWQIRSFGDRGPTRPDESLVRV